MALEFEDLKKIARKFGLVCKASGVDREFAFHSAVVGVCGNENRLSRHVQKLVERRFTRYAKQLHQQGNGAIMEFASNKAESNGVPLWAVLWHTATTGVQDEECIETALFGRIHMLEHALVKDFWNREGEDRSDRERDYLDEINDLRRELVKLQSLNAKLEKTNQRLSKRLSEFAPLPAGASSAKFDFSENRGSLSERKIQSLKFLLEESRKKSRDFEQECKQCKRQVEDLVRELASGEQGNSFSMAESQRNFCSCPLSHCLQGKRVAMVGGIDGLEAHYKNLVEQSGGEFWRHDGRCSRGERGLEECIRSADLVVCPVSVNSHFGAVGVKRLCKKHGINCCFPDSAGLGSLRSTLLQHFTPAQQDVPRIEEKEN